jgi:hypothetical protein
LRGHHIFDAFTFEHQVTAITAQAGIARGTRSQHPDGFGGTTAHETGSSVVGKGVVLVQGGSPGPLSMLSFLAEIVKVVLNEG